jgi:hypothetical protein
MEGNSRTLCPVEGTEAHYALLQQVIKIAEISLFALPTVEAAARSPAAVIVESARGYFSATI